MPAWCDHSAHSGAVFGQGAAPLRFVEDQDDTCQMGDVHVGPTCRDCSVFPHYAGDDSFDVVQVLQSALKYFGRRGAVQTLYLAHEIHPVRDQGTKLR